jgi:hypothetical protein
MLIDVVHNTTRRMVYEGQILLTSIPFLKGYSQTGSDEFESLKDIVQPEVKPCFFVASSFIISLIAD